MISIIIPTYKRLESLKRILASLLPQWTNDIEVIVVEQGQRNEVAIKTWCITHKRSITYIYTTAVSTSRAKNIGAKKAKGDTLIFFDDDVMLHPKSIRELVRRIYEKNIAGVGGRVVTVGQKEEPKNRNTGRISWIGQVSDGFSSEIPQEIDTVIGCHWAVKKEVFDAVGGFDEQFTGNAMREETDLCLAIKREGHTIAFEPRAVVTHMREPKGGARKTEGRLDWYYHFFSNETYFFLTWFHPLLFPLYIATKLEWIGRCMFGFGREVSGKSIMTPIFGIIDGIQKYENYRHRHRSTRNHR